MTCAPASGETWARRWQRLRRSSLPDPSLHAHDLKYTLTQKASAMSRCRADRPLGAGAARFSRSAGESLDGGCSNSTSSAQVGAEARCSRPSARRSPRAASELGAPGSRSAPRITTGAACRSLRGAGIRTPPRDRLRTSGSDVPPQEGEVFAGFCHRIPPSPGTATTVATGTSRVDSSHTEMALSNQ